VRGNPRIAVLTTSYPRSPDDPAGRFVADAVDHLRLRGVDVRVVSPHDFHHYGIADGAGVLAELRRRPSRALLLPLMLTAFARAARRAARDADLVHAHWLPTGLVALATGRPFVLHLHGTDMDVVARRAPRLARLLLRRARLVICVSSGLAEAARAFGATNLRVIPNGVTIPEQVGAEAKPAEVLFAGRLSPEKGIRELVEAAKDMRLVVAGDGPLRPLVPQALGFVPRDRLLALYERAAVVACPSRREGFGVVCAEAMAHGRPVVASAVGGLRDLVIEGETGLLVPPGDVSALRAALKRLLGDPELRRRLGAAARERAKRELSWDRVTDLTLAAYAAALGRT
jgi:glycosyltransferase involved in cell wall biosynthesis